jgi:hypothetical protein
MSSFDKWALPSTLWLDRVFPVPHEALMFQILFLTFSFPPWFLGILAEVITKKAHCQSLSWQRAFGCRDIYTMVLTWAPLPYQDDNTWTCSTSSLIGYLFARNLLSPFVCPLRLSAPEK